jgi:diaminohydroxyphosphoribosylaminopyrimidine deaminase/5-amino-6-(5-phosphoribosylamino)uracil reductase
MSMDAKIAMANGESQWITCELARRHGHLWRAKSGAIVTSSKTVKRDNCRLTVRDIDALNLPDKALFRQPLRVIVDTHLSVSKEAAIFQQPGKTLVATSTLMTVPQHDENVEYITLAEKDSLIDLNALFHVLGEREINDVLVEAGPTLTGALLQLGLVDELLVYIAPKLLGSKALSMANLPGFSKLSDALCGAFKEVERLGSDLFLVLKLDEFLYDHS